MSHPPPLANFSTPGRRRRVLKKKYRPGLSDHIATAVKVGNAAYQASKGNLLPAVSTAAGAILPSETTKQVPGMAPRRLRNRRRFKKRSRRNRIPPSLIPTTLHIRHIVPYAKTEGSQHRWYYTVSKNWLVSSFLKSFDEFKVISLTVRYVPNNSTNETGLYAGVLLDRGGFGSYGSATASQWFTTIGSMPGSKVRPRYATSVFRWRPTEPTVRDWIATNANINYCTVYVCNNGLETEELGGLFDVSARVQARGLYYNAAVQMYHQEKRKHLYPDESTSGSCLTEPIEHLDLCSEDGLPSDDRY